MYRQAKYYNYNQSLIPDILQTFDFNISKCIFIGDINGPKSPISN